MLKARLLTPGMTMAYLVAVTGDREILQRPDRMVARIDASVKGEGIPIPARIPLTPASSKCARMRPPTRLIVLPAPITGSAAGTGAPPGAGPGPPPGTGPPTGASAGTGGGTTTTGGGGGTTTTGGGSTATTGGGKGSNLRIPPPAARTAGCAIPRAALLFGQWGGGGGVRAGAAFGWMPVAGFHAWCGGAGKGDAAVPTPAAIRPCIDCCGADPLGQCTAGGAGAKVPKNALRGICPTYPQSSTVIGTRSLITYTMGC